MQTSSSFWYLARINILFFETKKTLRTRDWWYSPLYLSSYKSRLFINLSSFRGCSFIAVTIWRGLLSISSNSDFVESLKHGNIIADYDFNTVSERKKNSHIFFILDYSFEYSFCVIYWRLRNELFFILSLISRSIT